MAARHERLDVIDRLLALGTPVDAVDPVFGGHPLRAAGQAGRPGSVGQLLAAGAVPNLETTAVGRPWTSAGRVSQSTRASTAIARSRPSSSRSPIPSSAVGPRGVAPGANRTQGARDSRSSRCRRACIRASPASDTARTPGAAPGEAVHGLRRLDERRRLSVQRARAPVEPQSAQRALQHAGLAAPERPGAPRLAW